MPGSVSSIKLASNGLLLLGHQPIASFEEPSSGAQVASNLYETSYLSILTTYRWRFAAKKISLARLTEKPLNSFSYQYQLPSDFLYLIKTSSSNWEIYEDKLYSNSSTENIDYIYRVNEDRLPAYFSKAFEFFLAMQFAIPITGDLNKAAAMQRMYDTELKKAKFADATQRPPETFSDNPYVDVRY